MKSNVLKFTKIFLTAFLSLFLVLGTFSSVVAQGPGGSYGKPVIELMQGSKVVFRDTSSGVMSVPRDKVQDYSLRMSVVPNDPKGYPKQYWFGKVVTSNNNTLDLFTAEIIRRSGMVTKTQPFQAGTAALGNYKYTVTYSPDNVNFNSSQLVINFTDAKTPSVNTNPGGSPTNSGGSTNTGGIPSNANTPGVSGSVGGTVPDTGVSANIQDLDGNLGPLWNPLDFETVPQLITAILRILFVLIGIAAVIIIIIAGFRMVLASGNEEELTKAKKAITWAIVGLIVSLMSFSIVAIIQRLIQVGN